MHFDTYPLVDLEATKQMLAAQVAGGARLSGTGPGERAFALM